MDPATMALIASTAFQIGNTVFGGNDGLEKVSTLSRGQRKLHKQRGEQAQQLGAPGGGYQNSIDILQNMLNPQSDIYKNFEAPYRREFEEQTIPNLAERFAGIGAQGGALSSSGFGQALGAASAGLQEKLEFLKENLRQSAIDKLINQYNQMSQGYLNTPEFAYFDPGSGTLSSVLSGVSPEGYAGAFKGINNMFGQGGNQNYQAQYPLTNTYDMMFRTGAWT